MRARKLNEFGRSRSNGLDTLRCNAKRLVGPTFLPDKRNYGAGAPRRITSLRAIEELRGTGKLILQVAKGPSRMALDVLSLRRRGRTLSRRSPFGNGSLPAIQTIPALFE